MDRYCSKCGQKLVENATFCTNCGNKVEIQGEQEQTNSSNSTYTTPNQNTYTTTNQNTYSAPNQNTYSTPNQNMYANQNPNMYGGGTDTYPNQNYDPKVLSKNNLALALSIIGLTLSIIGAILFGLFLSLPAMVLGIVGLLISINVKKMTNNIKGTPAMICGILAIVFASIFTIGCMSTFYGCYGVAGTACLAKNAVEDIFDYSGLEKKLEDLEDYSDIYNNINVEDFFD